MKRIACSLFVLSFFWFSPGFAVTNQTQQKEPPKQPEAPKLTKQDEHRKAQEEAERLARAAKIAELETKVKQYLVKQEWPVYLVQVNLPAGSKPEIIKDKFKFTDVGITSKYLTERGYADSNYSLSGINEAGTAATWETMQRASEDVAFLRGQLEGQGMRGVIGLHPKKGRGEDFSFTTVKPEGYVEPVKRVETEKKTETAKKDTGEKIKTGR